MIRENEQDFSCVCILSLISERMEQALSRWVKDLPQQGVDRNLMVQNLANALADSKTLIQAAAIMNVSKHPNELQMQMVEILKPPCEMVVDKWNDACKNAAATKQAKLLKAWLKNNPLSPTQKKLRKWKAGLQKCRDRHAQEADREAYSKPLRGKTLTFFVASSSEAETTARKLIRAIHNKVGEGKWEILFWKDPEVFVVGESTLESLEGIFRKCDFGIYLLTADDKLVMRNKQKLTPRGNVVFELGMGVGLHGRRRSFIVHDDVYKISDLDGITTMGYKLPKKSKAPPPSVVDTIVNKLVHAVNKQVADSTKN